MVQEVRSILFTAAESRAALTELLMRRTRGLQASQIEQIEFEVVAGSVRAEVRFAAGLQPSRTLDSTELMTAVLIFCKSRHIPLSSRSHKRLAIIGGCLALTASLNLASAAPKVEGDTITHGRSGPDLGPLHVI